MNRRFRLLLTLAALFALPLLPLFLLLLSDTDARQDIPPTRPGPDSAVTTTP